MDKAEVYQELIPTPKVSFYEDVTDTKGKTTFFARVLEGIRNGEWKEAVGRLRLIQNETEQKLFKKTLPGFTVAGVFPKIRNSEGLGEHSSFIAVDFDAQDNPILLEKFDEIRQVLTGNQYTYCLFTSCRGKGFAVVIRIDGTKHLESFLFLENYYREKYGLVVDKACKDVSRLRFVSYDPDLYIAEQSETVVPSPAKITIPQAQAAHENNAHIINTIIASGKILGDDSYNSWTVKIGFPLVTEFGEAGRGYFHALSSLSPKYNRIECDRKYDDCLRTNRGDITFATIVHMAREAGVVFKNDSLRTPKALVNQSETNKAKIFNCTDLGNSKRLVALYGDKFRYCFAWKKWIGFDGKAWIRENNGQILRRAKATVHNIYREAYESNDPEMSEKLGKWGAKSQAKDKITAMVSLAESEEGVPISPDQLDTDNYLLNCKNGTVDLRAGELGQHNSKDFITKIISVAYDPAAQCPQWIDFLEKILHWNYDMINFLQRAIGYSLTGDVSEQCLFLLHGAGANGKSTLLNIIGAFLGDYAQTAIFDTFLAKKEERSVNNDIARMQGKRFVSAIEAEGERRLSEVLVKQLTGGDTVTARFLFAEFFEFSPQFKIWLACNHKPIIRGTDHAIWRRIRLIPFTVTIPEAARDKHLTEKLRAELPGILAWAVQGCLTWQKTGLQTPEEVKSATNEYQDCMDTIGAFISECCILTPEVRSKASDLYEVYKKWCEAGGEYALNQRSFGLRLTEKGLDHVKSSGNYRKGIGIKLEK